MPRPAVQLSVLDRQHPSENAAVVQGCVPFVLLIIDGVNTATIEGAPDRTRTQAGIDYGSAWASPPSNPARVASTRYRPGEFS